MQRLTRICVPAAIAAGTGSAIAAVLLIFVWPAGWLDVVLAATSVVFLPTGLVGAATSARTARARSDGSSSPRAPRYRSRRSARWSPTRGSCVATTAAGADRVRPVAGFAAVFAVPLVGTLGVMLLPGTRAAGEPARALALRRVRRRPGGARRMGHPLADADRHGEANVSSPTGIAGGRRPRPLDSVIGAAPAARVAVPPASRPRSTDGGVAPGPPLAACASFAIPALVLRLRRRRHRGRRTARSRSPRTGRRSRSVSPPGPGSSATGCSTCGRCSPARSCTAPQRDRDHHLRRRPAHCSRRLQRRCTGRRRGGGQRAGDPGLARPRAASPRPARVRLA